MFRQAGSLQQSDMWGRRRVAGGVGRGAPKEITFAIVFMIIRYICFLQRLKQQVNQRTQMNRHPRRNKATRYIFSNTAGSDKVSAGFPPSSVSRQRF